MILINKHIVPKGYKAITVFPFIAFKDFGCIDKVLYNHERIHLRQQLELLIIPFFIWYGVEYLINRIKYKDHNKAYLNISFEKEAYGNQDNFEYLKTRKWYSFLNKYNKQIN